MKKKKRKKKKRKTSKKKKKEEKEKKKKIYYLIWSGSGHLTFTTFNFIRCSKKLFQHVASQY